MRPESGVEKAKAKEALLEAVKSKAWKSSVQEADQVNKVYGSSQDGMGSIEWER